MSEQFLNTYTGFVTEVTSDPSIDFEAFITRLRELKDSGCEVQRLLTGAIGLSAEAGEFLEIVKKCSFQGKPWDEDNRFHIKRELGDIAFYWVTACAAIGEDPYEVINENVRKLEARYPGGKFSIQHSEVRAEGDL